MKIAVIHTGPVTLNPIKALFKQWLPEVEMVNIIDDSLLNDVILRKRSPPGLSVTR